MNIILEKTDSAPFFTDIQLTLNALGMRTADYDWYISDIETNTSEDIFPQRDQWMNGEKLNTILHTHAIQFIWAVFSAFTKGTQFKVQIPPGADGYADLWSETNIKPQLNNALFEIIAWDSSATIMIGIPNNCAQQFIRHYPNAKLLHPIASQ